jgi:hypothetical protein
MAPAKLMSSANATPQPTTAATAATSPASSSNQPESVGQQPGDQRGHDHKGHH